MRRKQEDRGYWTRMRLGLRDGVCLAPDADRTEAIR